MPKTLSAFSGIPRQGIEFLAELPERDKAWFNDWRDLYEEVLLEPVKALVVAVGQRIQTSISPTLVAKPAINGSISPIFRDLRFSKDKTVFKDNLMLNFWDGNPKKTAPTLRIRITPESIGFATGAVFADQPLLDCWRKAVADDGKGSLLQKEIDTLLENKSVDITEPELKKAPAGFDLDHPRVELLRRKSIQLRWPEKTPKLIHKAAFADWCAERLLRTRNIHRWLVKELQP